MRFCRIIAFSLVAVVALSLGACLSRPAGVATGLVSHQLCSAAFVSGVDPDQFFAMAVKPVIGPATPLLRYEVDRDKRAVTASLAGLSSNTAVYRDAAGCLVLHGAPPAPVSAPPPPSAPPLLAPIAGPALVDTRDPTLAAALDRAFIEPGSSALRQTTAVVILHDGRVIAERYAAGYGPDTAVSGWSMTKSVINALLGMLVRDGALDMNAPAPVAAWADPKDPRRAITPDNLLRMVSGLDIGESLNGGFLGAFDPTGQMMFRERDMAAYAEKARLKAKPGSTWKYTNGNTLLLSHIIRDLSGGDGSSVQAFARRELFDRLGLEHATLEMDATGTPMGGTHMWMTPRDWARLGMLYLNDGIVGGKRILPEGWIDYSARLTPSSEAFGYGAGFWTNRGQGEAASRVRHGMPADSFFMRGSYGQYVVIIPSSRLVIVRTGMAFMKQDDIGGIERLVADVVAAMR